MVLNYTCQIEVRAKVNLASSASFIGRHPFPGPGLAIRHEITREKLDTLRQADAVYIDQIRKHGLRDEIWQFVAIIPPVHSRCIRWAHL
jgi:GMP synthase (glutamine-hydrolysing)